MALTPFSKFLDRAKLEAAYITFSTLFDMVLTRVPTMFQDLCTVMPVSDSEVQFKWLGDVPAMERWIGPRAIAKLRAETHRITSEDWANGIEVARDDIADDKLGLLNPRISSLAEEGMWRMEKLVFDYLNGGFGATQGVCYDNQYLIDSDHTASGSGGTAQTNVQAGALSVTTYPAAWKLMMDFVDTRGEKLNIIPDTLLVGTANRQTGRKLIDQRTLATGEDNIEAGSARLLCSARVTGNNWFLMSTQQAVRAIILLIRQAPQFAAVNSFDDYFAFMNAVFLFGADARFGAGYGLWQTIVGSTG
jgi:phage major head subunit gpT-like protein